MSFWKKTLNMQVTFALWLCLHTTCNVMDVWSGTCLTPGGGLFTDEHRCVLPCPGLWSWQCCLDSSGYDCPHSFSPEAQHLRSLETGIQSVFLRYLGHSSFPWKGFKSKHNGNFFIPFKTKALPHLSPSLGRHSQSVQECFAPLVNQGVPHIVYQWSRQNFQDLKPLSSIYGQGIQ